MGRVKQTARKAVVVASKAPRMQRAQKGTKGYPTAGAVRTKKAAAAGGAGGGGGGDGPTPPRKHRFHPGTVSLREIRYYQKTTGTLAAKAPIERMIRRLGGDNNPSGEPPRYTRVAIAMLQAMLEHHLTNKLYRGYLVTLHSKRKTLVGKDLSFMETLETSGATEVPAPPSL